METLKTEEIFAFKLGPLLDVLWHFHVHCVIIHRSAESLILILRIYSKPIQLNRLLFSSP
jgi:hypothetical protein